MKKLYPICLVLLAGVSIDAVAGNCSVGGTLIQNTRFNLALTNLLLSKTLCAQKANGDKWQEYHQNGGQVIDYKEGPGHPVDPQKQVATWAASGSSVSYKYLDENNVPVDPIYARYFYSHFEEGPNVYHVCTSSFILDVKAYIVPGQVQCSSFPPL